MPEIKHTFQGGKMNKDLDERLVPNGEFRSAENVQVRTSKTDAIGTVQNIRGTAQVGASFIDPTWSSEANPDTMPTVVASVADEKSDKAYFFFASPPVPQLLGLYINQASNLVDSEKVFIDTIMEQDVNGITIPVVIDRHTIINTKDEVLNQVAPNQFNGSFNSLPVIDASKYRVGMTVQALIPGDIGGTQLVDLFSQYVTEGGTITTGNSGLLEGARIKHIDLENNIITFHQYIQGSPEYPMDNVEFFVFKAPPVLNFQGNHITGINIIDDLLFWTDNLTEPKKINISRCKDGSVDLTTHTKLFVDHPLLSTGPGNENFVSINTLSPGLETYPTNTDLLEEHITVLRPAPRTAPLLNMSDTLRESNISAEFQHEFSDGTVTNPLPEDGDQIILGPDPDFLNTDFKAGDRLDIIQVLNPDLGGMIVVFDGYINGGGQLVQGPPSNTIQCTIQQLAPPIPNGTQDWRISLKQEKPLFELKLARFGYRYKYEDGEYSAFSPWSELAFMPGEFDLVMRKAYNLGMVNHLRELIVEGFIPYKTPLDVKAVDILYKEASKPNVYVLKTVEKTKDDDWGLNTPSFINTDEIKTGRLNVTSEMIHKVLPANQTLRAWDNVPRYARAQEITANRLIYGNYTQGYPFNTPVSLEQVLVSIAPNIPDNDDSPGLENPKKSVKSLRHYKWGMVFGDRYGRETPVIESGYTSSTDETFESMSGDIVVQKDLSSKRNFFVLKQGWDSISTPNGEPPDWIDYVKYYVKETSNEYYNMVMDRWYWADEEQDNVWVAFNSADRNKIDEETYLVLKNQHGNHDPVDDPARFKVIAIENDAPDFIKTVRRPIGQVEIFPANMNKHGVATDGDGDVVMTSIDNTGWGVALVGSTNQGIPAEIPEGLMLNTTCEIYMTSWNETISGWSAIPGTSDPIEWGVVDFTNSVFGRRIDGGIKMRIRGDNGTNRIWTSWRNLYHYRFIERPQDVEPGPDYWTQWHQKIELNWDSTWQEEANLRERFLEAGYPIAGLNFFIEFVEDHIDHRPQFDGKFFVKLERNLELETHMMYSEGSGGIYMTKSSHPYVLCNQLGTSLGTCAANISSRDFWNSWTYASWGSGYKHAIPFIDMAPPFFVNFPNTPLSAAAGGDPDPNSPGWTTQGFVYGDGNITWQGGLQTGGLNPDGSEGMGRLYISYQFYDPGPGATEVDEDNDGWGDQTNENVPAFDLTGSTDFGWTQQNQFSAPMLNGLSEVGRKFKFSAAPDQIYEVIDSEFGIGPGGGVLNTPRNYGGAVPTDDFFGVDTVQDGEGFCYACGPNSSPGDSYGNGACRRRMLRIDFRRLNNSTNAPIYTGPGAGLPANVNPLTDTSGFALGSGGGVTAQMPKIYFVEPSDIFGSPGIKVELGGMWETEPKDDVDLELYYEATNAVPMRLAEYNTYDYIPIDGAINIRRWVNNVHTEVSLTNQSNGPVKVSAIDFLCNENPLVYLTSTNSAGETVPHVYDIIAPDYSQDTPNPTDTIVFNWPDGSQTSSGIIGEWTPDTEVVGSETSFKRTETIYREILMINPSSGGMYINDPTGLSVGDYIFSINSNQFQQYEIATGTATPMSNGVYDMNGNVFSYPPIGNDDLVGNTSIIPNGYVITGITQGAAIYEFPNNASTGNPDFDYDGFASANNPGWNITIGTIDADGNVTPSNPAVDPNWNLFMQAWYGCCENNVNGFSYPYQFNVRISTNSGWYEVDPEVWKYKVRLSWFNCYTFGNGVESDRIRDDYNALQIDNGVRVSTTFSGYGEERRSSGLIHSGLYNSTSEVNDLNEFNMGEKIQKNLNPSYGSIQALKTRDTDVVVFTEDKVLKVIANKDAVYNADGNPQLVATNRTLGQVIPFAGDYGISQNPESLAVDQYRMYFTDKNRGTVCRLSMDGITPISNAGMKKWFRENLELCSSIVGSFDDVNGEYNVTLNYDTNLYDLTEAEAEGENLDLGIPFISNWTQDAKTVSFNEGAKGWVSFKSFIPQTALSVSGKYMSARYDKIWEHYREFEEDGVTLVPYNNFHGIQRETRFSVVFNDVPGTIKHFNTINYEGSQSHVRQNLQDYEFYNIEDKEGWYVKSFETDLQSGKVNEFIDKENKWFNRIQGRPTTVHNFDTSEFTVQGLGVPMVIGGDYEQPGFVFVVQNDATDSPDATVGSTDGEGTNPNFNSESSTYEG